MLAQDGEMDQDVALALVADQEAEAAGGVEPLDVALDPESVRKRFFVADGLVAHDFLADDFDGHGLLRGIGFHASGLGPLGRFRDRRSFGTRLTHKLLLTTCRSGIKQY